MKKLKELRGLVRTLCIVLIIGFLVTGNLGCMVATRHPTIALEELQEERRTQAMRAEQLLVQGTERVATAAWPILTSNLELCGNFVEYRTGLWIAQQSKIVHSMMGLGQDANTTLGKEAIVWAVAPESPAGMASIRTGDLIVQVNEKPVTDSDNARRLLRRAMKRQAPETIEVVVRRDSTDHTVELTPVKTCRSQILVVSDNSVNAMANGRTIAIHTGLLQLMPDERDLQLVLAHELAHNVANHVPLARARVVAGGLLDAALAKFGKIWANGIFARLGAISFSKRYEREADYLAMYYLANADIDLENVEEIWRRLGELDVRFIGFGLTHPSSPERYITIRKTREEIQEKRAKGISLLPEKK